MSKSSAVVVPTTSSGTPQPGGATAVTPMQGGGLLLSPLPLSGGRKGSRKSKKGTKKQKLSKRVLKLFRKGSATKLKKMLKGGEEAMEEVASESSAPEVTEGASRRRSRKGGRKTRRSLY